MKKIVQIIYIIIFFCILAFPLIAMPFAKKNGEIEKKKLEATPKIIEDGKVNTEFSTSYERWLNEQLPFRSELLIAANYVKSDIFSSPTANVIAGKDGWLFYNKTAADYMNTNAMTDQEIRAIAVTLSLIQENIENNGGKFVFSPIPNKNEIYGEYMPVFYKKADKNNLSRLYGTLSDANVNHVNLLNYFLENKDLQLYHKKDTHWNYQGAHLAYSKILDSLKVSYKPYSNATSHVEKIWRADMSKLLYPSYAEYDYQYVYENRDFDEFVFVAPKMQLSTEEQLALFMSDKEDNDTNISTEKLVKNSGMRLYMVRDSFGRALLPYMIDNFDYATFERTTCPTLVDIEPGTNMIYEIGERNLESIISTAPFMMAPIRDNIKASTEFNSDKNLLLNKDEGYAYRIYGTVDEDFIATDSRIYVQLSDGENELLYEAFPIYEEKLLKDEEVKAKVGFSIILDSSQIRLGDYNISLISGDKKTGVLKTLTIGAKEQQSDEPVEDTDDNFEFPENPYNIETAEQFMENTKIKYNGIIFSVGDDVTDEFISSLGAQTAPVQDRPQCCAADYGSITVYSFDGMQINELAGKIEGVKFDKCVKNNGLLIGLRVGMSEDDVKRLVVTEEGEAFTFDSVTFKRLAKYSDGRMIEINLQNEIVTDIYISDDSYYKK